jgi:MFS family permease
MGHSFTLYAVSLFAAIGGLCFGYDTGVISSVLTMETFALQMTGDKTYLSSLETGTITGLLLAGCFVGSLLSGKYLF